MGAPLNIRRVEKMRLRDRQSGYRVFEETEAKGKETPARQEKARR